MKYFAINNPRTSYFVGGAEMVSMEHAKNMSDMGYPIYFFTIDPKSVRLDYSQQYLSFKQAYINKINFIEVEMGMESIPIYEIDPGEDRTRWNTESLFYNRKLFSAINNSKKTFDFMLSYFNLDALVIPKNKVIKNILYLCGIPPDESRFRTSFLAMYDKVIAITEETKTYWEKYCKQPIDAISTGVDTERFTPSEQKDGSIVFIGRLIERKGCDIFIKTIGQLTEGVRSSRKIIVIGEGPQSDALKELASGLGLKNVVIFVGNQDKPELFLSKSSICVFPSRNGEGLQGVILESMSCGACVLASDTKINKYLLGKNRGIIIDQNSPDDIANKIDNLLKKESEATKIGNNARKYIMINYSWKIITEELLREVL